MTGVAFVAAAGSNLYKGWRAWLWASAFLGMGELMTLGRFYFGSLLLGTIVAAIIAAGGADWIVQVIAFIVGGTAAIFFVRPWIVHHIHLDRLAREKPDDDADRRR